MIILLAAFVVTTYILLQNKNYGLNIIGFLLIFNSIMITGLNKNIFSTSIEVSDIFFISTLIAFIINALIQKRKYILKINYGDMLIFSYVLLIVLIPFFYWYLFSGYTANQSYVYKHFIPLRIFMLYKMWYFFLTESNHRHQNIINNNFFRVFIAIGITSAIIGMVRFLPFQHLNNFFHLLWPAESHGKEVMVGFDGWWRLWGTNGATNSAGNLFAILLIVSMWLLKKEWKNFYLISTIIFTSALLLTGSMSSIFAVLILFTFSKKIRFCACSEPMTFLSQ